MQVRVYYVSRWHSLSDTGEWWIWSMFVTTDGKWSLSLSHSSFGHMDATSTLSHGQALVGSQFGRRKLVLSMMSSSQLLLSRPRLL